MSCGCNLRKSINKEKLKLDKRDVYLDYNSTTKPDMNVLAEIDRVNRNFWGNPSAQNSRGVNLYNYITKKTDQCRQLLGIQNYDFWFDTSSTSIIEKISAHKKSKEIITSSIEHNSLLENSQRTIDVDYNGEMNLKQLSERLEKDTILIYSPVNHETGNIQPYKDIYKIAKEKCVKVIFDAVQTIQRINIKEWLPYCDGFYYSGHKIHGIQGGAVLFSKQGVLNFNSEDEILPFSLYSGTFNTPGVTSLLTATISLIKNFEKDHVELKILHRDAKQIISKLEKVTFQTGENSVPGIINITLDEIDNIEGLLLYLNQEGIQTGRLSACSGDINAESYVLKNMGRDSNTAKSSIRLSFGKYSKRDDFFRVSSSIKKYYNKL